MVIYINDLPDKIDNVSKLFAGDSKIISVIKREMDIDKLQNDLFTEANDARLGKSNPKAVYSMMDDVGIKRDIEKTNLERDLGITVDNNLK